MLKDRHIDQIFNEIGDLGAKIKFEYALDKKRENSNDKRKIENVLTNKSSSEAKILSFRSILEASPTSAVVVNYYNMNKRLDEKHRKILMNIIVNYLFYVHSTSVTTGDFEKISQEVIDTFPTESKVIPYFILFI